MLARLKRLEKLVADAEAQLADMTALASTIEARGGDTTKLRTAVVALTLALERHRADRDRTQDLWDRIAPTQRMLDARIGTVRGRLADQQRDE